MRKIVFIFLVIIQLSSQGQRLNFGFGFNFFSLYNTHIKNDVVFARHTYRAYYVEKNQTSFAISYQYNFMTTIDYGRYLFSAELGYFMQQDDGLKTKLSYPIANNEFRDYYSKISYAGYSLSPIVGYVLNNRRAFKLYAEVGLPIMLLNESLVSEKIGLERGTGKDYWEDQDEMTSEYGLTHDYLNWMVGIGYRISAGSMSIRYVSKINNRNDVGSRLGYFTLNITALTNFSKLKKHYIYIE